MRLRAVLLLPVLLSGCGGGDGGGATAPGEVAHAPTEREALAPGPEPSMMDGAEAGPIHGASGFVTAKMVGLLGCQAAGDGFAASYFAHGECARVDFDVTDTNELTVVAVQPVGADGQALAAPLRATRQPSGSWRITTPIDTSWPAGRVTLRVMANGVEAGEGTLFVNALGAEVAAVARPDGARFAPGEQIALTGSIARLHDVVGQTARVGVPATFSLRVRTAAGELRGPYGPFAAATDGSFPAELELPAAATAGLKAGPETDHATQIAVEVVDATFADPLTGTWANDVAGSVAVALVDRPAALIVEAKFVSSTGWVKPGQTYPFRVIVKNLTAETQRGVGVTIDAPKGAQLVDARTVGGMGTVAVTARQVHWRLPDLPADTVATLVVKARALTASEDPRIVWKDLSANAVASVMGTKISATTHGPKVIPPTGGFETARYGDKPFPVIPVDFRDRKHQPDRSGDKLATVINAKDHPGSTYNLYQEMSYGQLHPIGFVPSAGIATAGFDYEPGFYFSQRRTDAVTCRGTTVSGAPQLWGTPLYPSRISGGWYQLPGDTEYYGGDFPTFTATSLAIDQACGAPGKLVYDAAAIADPEVDYNDFDSDKDGLVDFLMVVFVGCGGNGPSQLRPTTCGPAYDNPWPHSSTLESYFSDPATGLLGYVSDDQLRSLEGVPQCWTDTTYSEPADCAAHGGQGMDDLPVFVRVGPYNINPETAVDRASVISHEYGHHLGLPDFYSTSYGAYNDLNLMAADYSQHMTIFSKQDLGWVVPRFLQPGDTRDVNGWREIKTDIGEIEWRTPTGERYTLSAANGDQNVRNGEAYSLKLPRRLVIDPAKVEQQASAPDLIWSGSGNDFGCAPTGAHNYDIVLPELEQVPPGTPVTLTFKSSWDIEWDYDYGFVLVTTDGSSYQSVPSEKGYTTDKSVNPNHVICLDNLDHGLTGTSGTYEAGAASVAVDRATGEYGRGSPFLEDEYDLSAWAGQRGVVLRFSYATDVGLARPGWFVDDVRVAAGDQVLFETSFTGPEDGLRFFPGGCGANGLKSSRRCTEGWSRLKADVASDFDHAYYLELRDRSGFDFEGRGQSDRGPILWSPGVFVEYTDEIRGYGNNGYSTPPRQHYLDSQPQPDYDCGGRTLETHPDPAVRPPARCQDASFTAAEGDNAFQDVGWVDNFWDDSSEDGLWHFDYGCLALDVLSMSGDADNTEALPSDLAADARVVAGSGCEPFAYGWVRTNVAPTAVASATPKTARVGDRIRFDAAGSFDDLEQPEQLGYAWSLGDGTTRVGRTVSHAYRTAGTYTAMLTVSDRDGLSSTATVMVTVEPAAEDEAADGGWCAVGAGPSGARGTGLVVLVLGALGALGTLRRGAPRHRRPDRAPEA